MTRILTCLGMISVLLLTMASKGFVPNEYQKVYAAGGVPTSDLATKIRESHTHFIQVAIFMYDFLNQKGYETKSVISGDWPCTGQNGTQRFTCTKEGWVGPIKPNTFPGRAKVKIVLEGRLDQRITPSDTSIVISGLQYQLRPFEFSFAGNYYKAKPHIPAMGYGDIVVRVDS